MPQAIDPALKAELLTGLFQPAITTYNRLDVRARREEFDRSLRAEVRDPLWMLCRQWQFGEFKGEDGGSAIQAKVQLDTTCLNRFAVKTEDPTADGGVPRRFGRPVPGPTADGGFPRRFGRLVLE